MPSQKRTREDSGDQLDSEVVQHRPEIHANKTNKVSTLTQEFKTEVESMPRIWLIDDEDINTQTSRFSRSSSPSPIPYEPSLPLRSSDPSTSSHLDATYHPIPLNLFCDTIFGPWMQCTKDGVRHVPARREFYGDYDFEAGFCPPQPYLDAYKKYNASFDSREGASNRRVLLANLLNSMLDETSPSLRCHTEPTKGKTDEWPETIMGFRYQDVRPIEELSALHHIVVAVDVQSMPDDADDLDDDEEYDYEYEYDEESDDDNCRIYPPYPLPGEFAAEHALPRYASRLRSYASAISRSGCRRHVLGILVRGAWLSLYAFDPSGGVYTPFMSLVSESNTIINVLQRLAASDPVRLGMDPTFISDKLPSHTAFGTLAGRSIMIGGHRVTLTNSIYAEGGSNSWGATIFEAKCQSDTIIDLAGRQRNFRCGPLPDKALVKIHWKKTTFDEPYAPIGKMLTYLPGATNAEVRVTELRCRLSDGIRKELRLGFFEDYWDMEQWVEFIAPNSSAVNFEEFKATFLKCQ
ncbi:uncharacterized protein EI90DRAFT_3093497 [Cantharellus anzutake]|uniref:uncharacterized protein n=1 Tax=Cantharellus anzutake TaxID=1750568 RepID=UPI001903AB2A|nr:uncharacterized protein EI90DRAFT_3093497 [Cantharellus anzutake]KAF8312550.1 hypothetical protein EI90DRAFT_3093497 [Cantharellus anzutake]